MKNWHSLISTILFFLVSCSEAQYSTLNPNDFLLYDSPARIWEESLPLGNGRLGCSDFGGTFSEHIVLNEISMWSGSEADYSNPKASESLPKIRKLLFEKRNVEAQNLMFNSFVPNKTNGASYGSYQMLADLMLTTILSDSTFSSYSRRLDMKSGVTTTHWMSGDSHYKRQIFVSRSNDIIVIRQYSDTPFNMRVSLSRPERGESHFENGTLSLLGQLDSGTDQEGVRFVAKLIPRYDGTLSQLNDSTILLSDVSDVCLIISASTSYLYGDEYITHTDSILSSLKSIDYATLKSSHIEAHSELYNRVALELDGSSSEENLTTDERIRRFAYSQDPGLVELYYNFGRYSLISSTRPGSLPPNLQGLWANECGTPWNGDYHTNINVQMNHWPLETGNLSELYDPLIRLVENSVESGSKTAKDFYGKEAHGWVMHMMTNVWKFTAPGDHPSWGATNTGGAWLCAHLWEHYEYTLDTLYLKRVYPIMKGCAEFFHSTMVREPSHNWLVTAPTSSPENEFLLDGHKVSVCFGPTMDTQIISELFGNVVKSSQILGVDEDFASLLCDDLRMLPPMQVSKNGYLMEWLEDYEEVDIHHRHVSHLYGLHPSRQISPDSTPELAEACRATLNRRGDEGTGWSRAWKVNFWARLADGNRALKLLTSLITPAIDSAGNILGGTFPNMWCSHPPFQLDGNFGGTAGIAEMLVQSHMGFVDPLPALPDKWRSGSVRGMCVRGGGKVDMQWCDGCLTSIRISGGKLKEYDVALPKNCTKAYISGKEVQIKRCFGERKIVSVDNGSTISFSF
ncbi:MAG: glycoside hydrolase family 95 protein [Bacteroidales bacterium]|nr:glycoside hydrolase family 95 protein [Bacteroidales bacterium]